MSHLNPSHSKPRSGFAFLLLAALFFGAPGAVGAQELGEEKTIEFEQGGTITSDRGELVNRVGVARNKIKVYLIESRTSAKEGLQNAYNHFVVWFRDYNERTEPPGVQLIQELLFGVADVVALGLPATGAVDAYGSKLLASISDDLSDDESDITERLVDTQDFLAELERLYDRWIVNEGLAIYDEFNKKDNDLFKTAVDRYLEDYETYTLTGDGVQGNGPLRRLMEDLGVSAPGRETRHAYQECGLFLLVKHTVSNHHEHIGLIGGETPWGFLDLDLDNYVRLEQIGPRNYVHWKSNDYDICPDAEAL